MQDIDLGGGLVEIDAPKVPLILMILMMISLMKRPKMPMLVILPSPQLM
jgi:hypothetical protein